MATVYKIDKMELRAIFYDLINEYGMLAVEEQLRVVKMDMLNNYAAVLRANGYEVVKGSEPASDKAFSANAQSVTPHASINTCISARPTSTDNPVTVTEPISTDSPVTVTEPISNDSQVTVTTPPAEKKKRVYKINKVEEKIEEPIDGDYNKVQRQKEKEKRDELKRAGVDMKTVLTVENVKKWLEEGHSYAWIAREKVGCKQELISKFAKLNGINGQK